MIKYHNYFQEMIAIYERLSDGESKKIFEARITYMLDNNRDNYIKAIGDIYRDWAISEIEEKLKTNQEIILFGCGHDGRQACMLLMWVGYKTAYYCDNYQYGKVIDGRRVLSVDEVIKGHRDALVIIASSKYGEGMYIQLVKNGFPYQNILLPKYKEIIGIRGKQYFDVFKPLPDEIYIDAGTFDGGTVLDFCDWTKGRYQKVYAFEPIKDMCKIISEKVEKAGIKNIQIVNRAVWKREEILNFSENGSGSGVNSDGDTLVQGVDIDSVINQEKVTFIKMDVEGSELEALKGAEKTIRINKPRLAICIYHKRIDMLEIATYLLKVVPEYNFYIRQYWSNMWETVLYAYVFR